MPIYYAQESAHLCYVRAAWSDSWTEAPLLQCLRVHSVLAPSHSSAQFHYRYGRGQLPAIGSRPADLSLNVVSKPSLVGWYVKVDIVGLGTWYGILTEQDDQQEGTLDGIPTGYLTFTAFGVTRILEQSDPVTRCKIKTTSATPMINMALPFNGGSDGRKGRSRLATANYLAADKCFADKTVSSSLALWTGKNAVEYLLENFAPKDAAGVEQITWVVGSASLNVLDYELPYLPVHGKTLWQLINEIVDRRRGLVWWFEVNGSDELELMVDSTATSNVSLPSGATILANRNQFSYSFDTAINISSVSLTTSALQYFDQVRVEGNRAGVVMTVSPHLTAGQMVPDWGSTEQTAYNDAATGSTGFSALTDTEKEAVNADFRARDDMARVFSWWRLDLDWDGKGRNEGSTNQPAIITFDEDCVVDEATVAPFWLDGLRFEEFIPLRPGIDYSGTITPATDTADDEQRDYLPPAVWYQLEPVNTETGSVDDGWVHCERINAAIDAGETKRKYKWSIQLRVRDDVPGLVFEVVGGQPHYCAEDEYVSNGAYEDIPSGEGVAMRNWLATVYVLLHQHVFAVFPLTDDVTGGDCVRIQRIGVQDAYLDYLVEGTVTRVENGALEQADGGFLRDDRDRLKDIAKMAYSWYGVPRKTLQLSFKAITDVFQVGHMINTITQDAVPQTVNTVISSVSFDLISGQTAVNTSFSEIDFGGLA